MVELATAGSPVQLLRQSDRLLVHVVRSTQFVRDNKSTLYVLDGDQLVEWATFPDTRSCSVDANGYVLARNVDGRRYRTVRGVWVDAGRTDQVLAPDGTVTLDRDLGGYDCFNHYLCIDGGPALFYLSGEDPEPHRSKVLHSIRNGTAVHREAPWDPAYEHLMVGTATLVDNADLVRAYCVHDPKGFGPLRIERWSTADNRVVWRHPVRAAAHALVHWPAVGAVAAGLADGTLCILGSRTGAVLLEEIVMVDGARTIVTAIAVLDRTIALGTMNGHVVLHGVR